MEISSQQRTELEAAVEADPAAPGFAALAELERRAQRPAESERIAREGLARKPDHRDGRIVLALALIDQGRVDEARQELWRVGSEVLASHGMAPEAAGLSDDELDRAFDGAETDTDELIDPHRVAEEALSHVDGADAALDEADAATSQGDALPEDADEALPPGSAFATATMADLLERQGDTRGAERIRRALATAASAPAAAQPVAVATPVAAPPDPAPAPAIRPRPVPAPAGPTSHPSTDRRSRVVATLERWLENLRGERA